MTTSFMPSLICPVETPILFTDQGLTPQLSKLWMALAEFTKLAMEGLLRGDMQITIGTTINLWEKIDREKIATVGNMPAVSRT